MLRRIFEFSGRNNNNIFQPKDPQTKLIASRSKIPFYRKLSENLIKNTDDSDLDKLISGNIFAILQENKKHGKIWENKKISEGQRAFYITRIIEGEVSNGGFTQLFFNTQNEDHFALFVPAFDRINAPEFSLIVSAALEIHKKEDSTKTNRTLQQFAESYYNNIFNELDKQFYQANRKDSQNPGSRLNQLRLQYVKKYISEFI